MNYLDMAAIVTVIGLSIWLLFSRQPATKKPMIWLCVGALFISLSYLFAVRGACVGLVFIGLTVTRFRHIDQNVEGK